MSTLVTTNLKNPSNPGNNLVLEANGSVLFSAGTATVPSISFTGDLNTGIYSPGADQVAISTGGSGRLFVDASGRLGIGTSSPNYTLDVAGTINANATVRTSNGTHIGILGSEAFAAGVVGVGSTSNHPLVLGTNSLERLRITSAGLVGIGTSSPQAKLEVVGGTNAIYSLRDTGNGGLSIADFGGGVAFGTSSGGSAAYIGGSIQIRADQTWTAGSSHPSNLIFSIAASGSTTPTERLRITSAGLLGVGTSSPEATIDINATTASLRVNSSTGTNYALVASQNGTGACRLGVESSTGGSLLAGATSYSSILCSSSSHSLHLGTNATTALTIDTAQRVGIGTSSPTENLTIYGNSSRFSVTGLTGSSAILLGNQNSGGANNPSVIEAANGALYFGGGNSWSGGGTFDYTMTLTNDNKVGIGTTNPSTSLSIGASASSSFNGGVCLNRGPSVYNFYEASDGTNTVIFGLDHTLAVAKIGSVNSYPIGFFTGNTERLRITSAGLVGVGTSSPEAKLDIASLGGASNAIGAILRGDAGTGNSGGLALYNSSTDANQRNWYLVSNSTVYGDFAIKQGNSQGASPALGTDRFYISRLGNVGVGTTSPIYVVDIKSATDSQLRLNNSNETSHGSHDANIVAGGNYYQNPSFFGSSIKFNTYNGSSVGERLRIDSSGRVGIGTSSPSGLLHVAGQIYSSGTGYTGTNSPTLRLINSTATTGRTFGINSADSGIFQVFDASAGDATRLCVDSSGRVGIGTASPAQLLHLKGSGDTKLLLNSASNASDRGIYFATSTDSEVLGYIKQEYSTGQLQISSGTGSYASDVAFRTAGFERAKIDISGRLLVGTSTGSYKFQINALGSGGFAFDDVSGTISNTFGTGGSLALRAQVASSSGGGEIYLGGSTRGDSNINSIVLSTANTERMRIDSSGRVGIGTTSPGNANTTQVSSDGDGIRVQYANTPTGAVGPRLIFGHNTNNGTQQIFSAIKSLMASGNDADWSSHLGFYTGGSSLTERIRIPAQGGLSVGSSVSPNALTQSTGIRLGESTIASHTFTNVTTSPVTIANGVGIGGLAFVQAYNTGNGAQYTGLVMWRSGVVAVVFESNSLGFGLTYSVSGSTLLLQTASGTITGSVITFAS